MGAELTGRPESGRKRPRSVRAGCGRAPAAGRTGPLPGSFHLRPVLEVARDLLGMRLVRTLPDGRRLEGWIVEVEAYDGASDLACHASRGRTPRTEVMFGPPGRAYVYLVYGMHHCLNVVTGPEGYPAAVLIRAVDPGAGREWMVGGSAPASRIASGPGRLTRAFRIGRELNGADLCLGPELLLEADEPVSERMVVRGPRIGVDYAGDWAGKPWRLGVRGHPALSRPFFRAGRAVGAVSGRKARPAGAGGAGRESVSRERRAAGRGAEARGRAGA